MPTLTIYTDPDRIGTCDVPPFVVGDATQWVLKFHNGTAFYAPSGVTMRVGNVNGLEDGSYPMAFVWRMISTLGVAFDVDVVSGVPNITPLDAPTSSFFQMVGAAGVWALRDGRAGPYRYSSYGYSKSYRTQESGINIFSGVKIIPYSDANILIKPHAMVVVRPRLVADATITAPVSPATDWTAVMNPVNAYVMALLSLKRSALLDIQIFGDGRLLFQGALAVLQKIN